jgi:hypothetical protein
MNVEVDRVLEGVHMERGRSYPILVAAAQMKKWHVAHSLCRAGTTSTVCPYRSATTKDIYIPKVPCPESSCPSSRSVWMVSLGTT